MQLPFRDSELAHGDLPPNIVSNISGSWAFSTITKRIPTEIAPRIVKDNKSWLTEHPLCSYALSELMDELSLGKGGLLRELEDGGPDGMIWTGLLESIPLEQRNWIDSPWLIAEYYFYRRVVSCFRYFETGYDMFQHQKRAGLFESLPMLENIAEFLRAHFNMEFFENSRNLLHSGVFLSLWGNKLDLSLWPSYSASQSDHGRITTHMDLEQIQRFILDDHSTEVIEYLMSLRDEREVRTLSDSVDIIVDNAGYELITDFVLAMIILQLDIVERVCFHTKGHPTFVSDATTKDCLETIQFFLDESECQPNLRWFAMSLQTYIANGRLVFLEDLFWCQPIPMWNMPMRIQNILSTAKLVIVKGDANYRRLLGDRHWDFDTPAAKVLSYWPAGAVCALRTLKAEIACGIENVMQEYAFEHDPQWLTSGKWGIVQFYRCDL